MSHKAITLRLPPGIYERIKLRNKKNVTAFIVDAVESKLREEEQEELARSLAMLAEAPDDNCYEEFADAQREAMKNVD